MKSLIKFELRKIWGRPLVLVIFGIMLVANGINIFLTPEGRWFAAADVAHKEEQLRDGGAVTPEWTMAIAARLSAVESNPANLVSEQEKEELRRRYLQKGYSAEYVANLPNAVFLRPEVERSRAYLLLMEARTAANFYDYARALGADLGAAYRRAFPGTKGEALALRAESMYSYLANDYAAYYDYKLGWLKLHALQHGLPFTLGLFLIISLSPVFAGEYSLSTDALVFPTKYGKSKMVVAKILGVLITALGTWALLVAMNIFVVSKLYGLEGARSFVQDWAFNTCPFPLNQRANYLLVLALSALGVVFFAMVVAYLSARSKSISAALFINSLVLVGPLLAGVGGIFLFFTPSQIMIAASHFTHFSALYAFGRVLLLPYLVPPVILGAILILIVHSQNSAKKRAVES